MNKKIESLKPRKPKMKHLLNAENERETETDYKYYI